MKVNNTPESELTDDACKAATGKTMKEWFALLDARDGQKAGRRENGHFLQMEGVNPWWLATLVVEYENHHGMVKKDGLAEGYTICVTKGINAPVEKVYAAWTDPSLFTELFGDNAQQTIGEGGVLTCDAGCKAVFTRVRENKDLRFTWEHPDITAPITTDVQFQDNKGKTLMNVMSSRIQTRGEADGLRASWAAFLTGLKSKCEA